MKKKSISELALNKNVITKLSQSKIVGGADLRADLGLGGTGGGTYTCKASPMTSCNGKCPSPSPTDTSYDQGCRESVQVC